MATLASWISERSSEENESTEETTPYQLMQLEDSNAGPRQEIFGLCESIPNSLKLYKLLESPSPTTRTE